MMVPIAPCGTPAKVTRVRTRLPTLARASALVKAVCAMAHPPSASAAWQPHMRTIGWPGVGTTPPPLAPGSACLYLADLRGATAAAGLDIADVHMAILDPAGPPIRVDRGVCQDHLPPMPGGHPASQVDSGCLI